MYGTYVRLGVHVGAGSRDVVRAARRKLAPWAFTRAYRERRKQFYRTMLEYHAQAGELYRRVMRGEE